MLVDVAVEVEVVVVVAVVVRVVVIRKIAIPTKQVQLVPVL